MLTCYACQMQFRMLKELLYHIRKDCVQYSVQSLGYRCGEVDCYRYFNNLDSFRRHMSNHVTEVTGEIVSLPLTDNAKILDNISTNINTPDNLNDNRNLPYESSLFIASLYKNPSVPRSTVQIVVDGLQTFLTNVTGSLKDKFYSEVPSGSITAEVTTGLNEMLSLLENSMAPFHSEYKRLQKFTELGTYISPVEITVGHINTGVQQTPCTMQVIPLRQVLQNFFSIEDIWNATLSYLHYLEANIKLSEATSIPLATENVIQGSVWKNICSSHQPENSRSIILPLVVFYDDFEVGNPLGSHAGLHKLGGIYISLPALPPHLFSLLNNIFLAGLCHSSDKSQFGNKAVFDNVIKELNYLKITGIVMNTHFFKGTLKFQVVAITGDNLGLNSILGFTESFNANKYCRICDAVKMQMQTMTFENSSLLRNMTLYRQQLQLNNLSETGIKEECCWLSLDGFDLFDNVTVDVMHDILEGISRYVITFLVNYFISMKFLDFNILKLKLQSFDYGADSGSKPCNCFVLEGSKVKVKTSAAEMLTLLRYFGLLVGYYIPSGNKMWELYIYLRKITERLLCHRVYRDTTDQLKQLIADFNLLYSKLTGEPLKPKFHFLTHYPAMLKKFGPLSHLWTMRFEAKHRVSKMVARASCNKVNICKTIAIKNQLILNDVFLRKSLVTEMKYGKKKLLFPDTTDFKLGPDKTAKSSVAWIKVKGTTWRENDIVTLDIVEETNIPSFASVKKILLCDNNDIFFYCQLFETLSFNDHYQAYEVQLTEELHCFPLEGILAPIPNTLTLIRNYSYFVTIRWLLD